MTSDLAFYQIVEVPLRITALLSSYMGPSARGSSPVVSGLRFHPKVRFCHCEQQAPPRPSSSFFFLRFHSLIAPSNPSIRRQPKRKKYGDGGCGCGGDSDRGPSRTITKVLWRRWKLQKVSKTQLELQ